MGKPKGHTKRRPKPPPQERERQHAPDPLTDPLWQFMGRLIAGADQAGHPIGGTFTFGRRTIAIVLTTQPSEFAKLEAVAKPQSRVVLP